MNFRKPNKAPSILIIINKWRYGQEPTSWSGHVHGVREISPVDAWVVCLLFEYFISLVSKEKSEMYRWKGS